MQAPSGRVVCFGEAMLRTSSGIVTPGGSEFNVACALSRLGVASSWVSAMPVEVTPIDELALDAGVFVDVRRTDFPIGTCLLYTSPSPRDRSLSRMPSSA